jgi:nitrogen fixation/metabolism regulation signal transduction histidine kinase
VSLRTRLVLALLAMALLPTLVLTLYTRYQIGVASQWWTLPGIERALDSSLKVSRAVVARMDTEMHDQAERFALEPPIAAPSPDERHRMALELDDAGIDLLQTYRRASGGWRLESEYRPLDESDVWEPALGAVLDSALADGGTVHSPLGALGSAARTRDGRVVVAALRVEPHFFDQVALIAHGVEYYRGHGLVADIQRQYAWMLVTALVLALVAVAGVLATSQAGQISRPLAELSDALDRIAAGDWHARVAPRGALEMRRLGQAFNSMAERLEAAMAALRQAEREAAWRTVAQRLAHEFKNILTPMSLSLHLLADRSARAPDDAERAEALGALERGVSHLGRLAEQFSQYARLPEPRLEPLDLATLARSAAPAGEVQVAADAQVAVAGDSLLLSRAIHNLVLNAVEASAAGAIVEVRVRAERPHAVLEVLDRGAGVPAEIATRIFEPYVSSKQRGSGLGLALVRDIAQQHGGDVTLEPREGGGTRARLTLPLAGPAPAEGASPGGG